MRLQAPLEQGSWIESEDGSLHNAIHRLHLETRHNTDRYGLPPDVGTILHIRVTGSGLPRAFSFLECPASASYYHVFANGFIPTDIHTARTYLRHVHDRIPRALWYRLDNEIVLYPAPVDAGQILTIDYEENLSR